MYWAKKINTKIYASGTAANVLVAGIFGYPEVRNTLWLLVVLLGAVINHYSSIYVVGSLIQNQLSDSFAPVNKRKMAFYLVLKIASLLVAFALLVNFARPLVAHGIILYIFQLIILGLSIKNIAQFIKKGPSE